MFGERFARGLGVLVLALLLAPFPRLLVHASADAVVFGRYSPSYVTLLAGYGALLLAGLVGLVSLFRWTPSWISTGSRTLAAIRRRPLVFSALLALPPLLWIVAIESFQRFAPGRSGWVQLPWLALAIVANAVLWLGGRAEGRRVAQSLLFVSSLSLTLFALEWTLRTVPALIPLAVGPHLAGKGKFLRNDLVFEKPLRFGFRYAPNQDRWVVYRASDGDLYRLLGDQIEQIRPDADQILAKSRFVTDENGYPNQPPLQSRFDIVVAGDSFSVPGVVPTAWPDLLEEWTGLAVLNLSMPGYSPRPEVEAFKAFGFAKRPRWVVIAYFEGNDLIFEAPGFERKRQSGLSWIEEDFQAAGPYRSSVALQTLRHGAPAVFRSLWRRVGKLGGGSAPSYRYPVTARIAGVETKLAFYDLYVAALTAKREEIEQSRNLELVADALDELARLARREGAEPLLLYIPSKPRVYLPLLREDEAWRRVLRGVPAVRLAANGYLAPSPATPATRDAILARMDDQAASIEQLAVQKGMRFVNLTAAFRARAAEGEAVYYLGDTHWNQRGHEIAARELARLGPLFSPRSAPLSSQNGDPADRSPQTSPY